MVVSRHQRERKSLGVMVGTVLVVDRIRGRGSQDAPRIHITGSNCGHPSPRRRSHRDHGVAFVRAWACDTAHSGPARSIEPVTNATIVRFTPHFILALPGREEIKAHPTLPQHLPDVNVSD